MTEEEWQITMLCTIIFGGLRGPQVDYFVLFLVAVSKATEGNVLCDCWRQRVRPQERMSHLSVNGGG